MSVSANQQVRIPVVVYVNQLSHIYVSIIDGRRDSVCVLLEIAVAIVDEEERIIRGVRDENVEITILGLYPPTLHRDYIQPNSRALVSEQNRCLLKETRSEVLLLGTVAPRVHVSPGKCLVCRLR